MITMTTGAVIGLWLQGVVAFLAAALGWWILSTTEIGGDSWFSRLAWRVPAVIWGVIGTALLVIPVWMRLTQLVASDGCGSSDLPWWLYYTTGCWL